MGKLIVCFNLPFTFVSDDEYQVELQGNTAKIKITHIPNPNGTKLVTGLTTETSGSGTVKMEPDIHGIMNISKVTTEFPNIDISLYDVEEDFALKTQIASINYLNRLVQVVRSVTNKYWLRRITLRDIFNFRIFYVNNKGETESLIGFGFGGYRAPRIKIKEETAQKDRILGMLESQSDVQLYCDLLLDAHDYFAGERFNEAVIVANIALESFVADYIFNKLKLKYKVFETLSKISDGAVEGDFHKVMRGNFFKNLKHDDLITDDKYYKKFHDARELRRIATHGHTRKLNADEAHEAITKIRQVINYINKNNKQMTIWILQKY